MDQSKPARREFQPRCLILGADGGHRHAATYLCLGPILVDLGHTSLHVAITVDAHCGLQINARIRMLHCDKSPDKWEAALILRPGNALLDVVTTAADYRRGPE
jgi:hypothetical protein